MSWSFSPGLAAAFLAECCSDTDPSVPSNTTPTPDQYYWPDKPTEHSRLSRFGTTCEPLTDGLGEELLTWFREGFPARTSASLEKARELTENDQDCGEKWRGWLAKYDPVSSSWKTAQLSLLGDLIESSVILPRSGMTRGGLLWELPMLERRTTESVYGFLLPTPVASDSSCGAVISGADTFYTAKDGKPRKINRMGTDGSVGLARLVKMWPLESPQDGDLNPAFSEWLMGWPIGHTDLKPLETARFREYERQHGECLTCGGES